MRIPTLGALVVGSLLAVALGGCGGQSEQVRRLYSAVPQERFEAIRWLARHGSEDVLPSLIASLEDEDPSVRWAAIHALRDRTGENFGYRPEDREHRRLQAAGRWRHWWERTHNGQAEDDTPSGTESRGTEAEKAGGPSRPGQLPKQAEFEGCDGE